MHVLSDITNKHKAKNVCRQKFGNKQLHSGPFIQRYALCNRTPGRNLLPDEFPQFGLLEDDGQGHEGHRSRRHHLLDPEVDVVRRPRGVGVVDAVDLPDAERDADDADDDDDTDRDVTDDMAVHERQELLLRTWMAWVRFLVKIR